MSFLAVLAIGIMIVLTLAAVAAILLVCVVAQRGVWLRINQVIDSYKERLESERDFAMEINRVLARINASIKDANTRVQKRLNSHV